MSHLLEADGIQLSFNGRNILYDIYLQLTTGNITGLLGRNGEGKSCLMKIIYGTLKAEKSVRIDWQSQNEAYKSPALLRYLPQYNFIPKSLSLKQIFKDYALDYAGFEHHFPAFKPKYTMAAGSLSGGERRLVELYIIVKPAGRFVLLDEPFTHLNPLQIEEVVNLLTAEKKCKGLLVTDHMYRQVIGLCNPLYVLANGKTHVTQSMTDIERLGYARL